MEELILFAALGYMAADVIVHEIKKQRHWVFFAATCGVCLYVLAYVVKTIY